MLPRLSTLLHADLAIDLGTAATRVALPGEGVVLEEPSVVAVSRTANRLLSGGCAVGHLARQMLGRTPDSVSVVRPLAGGVITNFQLCEAMLRYFLRSAAAAIWVAAASVDGGAGLLNAGGKTCDLHQRIVPVRAKCCWWAWLKLPR